MTDARVARHEAAHAVADLAFGLEVQIVSIRPTDRYRGVCRSAHRLRPVEGFRPELPVFRQPPELRASIEAEIISALAGPMATEWMFADASPRVTRGEDPCEAAARSAVEALPPRHRELLADLETGTNAIPSDDETSLTLAGALAGNSQAPAYYGWLRQCAREFVGEYRVPINAVAAALAEATVLTGEQVAAIAKGAR